MKCTGQYYTICNTEYKVISWFCYKCIVAITIVVIATFFVYEVINKMNDRWRFALTAILNVTVLKNIELYCSKM